MRNVIANVKWTALGMPLVFVALVVSIDCSNSTTLLCPDAVSQLTPNGSCATEGLVCPYVNGGFDQNRTDSPSDCFGDFIEYACTQKKWTLAAQAAVTCSIDTNGVATSLPTTGPGTTACSLGFGRCAAAPGSVICQAACESDTSTSYTASCVGGQFVVTPISCTTTNQDAGSEDAQASDASATDDAASDAATDAGDD